MLWDPLNAWPKGRRWLWAVLAGLVCLTQGSQFIHDLRPPRDRWSDFFQEWASARNYQRGLPIYSDLRLAVEQHLGYRVDAEDPDNFGIVNMCKVIQVNAHPPTAVSLALPLGYLDYPDAVLCWNVLSLGAFLLSLWLVARSLLIPISAWSVLPFFALILLCGPFREQAVQGQLNLILLLLLTGMWMADRSEHPIIAGILLALAAAIKLFPAFLFVYFLLRRRWKSITVGVAILLIATGFIAAMLGVDTYVSYTRDVIPQTAVFRSGWGNASLPGIWTKLFDPAERERIEPLWRNPVLCHVGIFLSVLSLVGVLIWRGLGARNPAEEDRVFGLAVTAMLLISPVTWSHYLLLLLVPLALTWVWLPASNWLRTIFCTILMFLWLIPGLLHETFIPGGRLSGAATPVHTLTILSLQCYALLGLFILLAWLPLRESSTSTIAGCQRNSFTWSNWFVNGRESSRKNDLTPSQSLE